MGNATITVIGRFDAVSRFIKQTGVTEFSVIPEYAVDGVKDGVLRCCGKIRPYPKGITIQVEGHLNHNRIFEVEHDGLPSHSKEGTVSILEYISGKLTVAQMDAIARLCNNDLFSLCGKEDSMEKLKKILCRANKGEELAKYVYQRLCEIQSEQVMGELLLRYGIPFDKIMKLVKKGETFERIKMNPYLVFSKCDIPLQQADLFAREECGVGPYDTVRIKGFICSALRYILSCGDTCCTIRKLEQTVNRRYQSILNDIYFGPTLINFCVLDMPSFCRYHEVDGESLIYINHVWDEESNTVYHFERLQTARTEYCQDVGADVTERSLGIQYNAEQRSAFDLLKTSGIKILTGPPGSGKTATIKGLIHNFEINNNGTIKLAATTGMAARVIRASARRNSETVHMMLRVIPYNETIKGRDLNDPVDADLIVVDEVSMMGLQLFSALVQAVKNGAILLLVGDENQLESVEYGNILHDLIRTGRVEVCRLTEVLRQSGSIRINADRIMRGNQDLILDRQFRILRTTEKNVVSQILEDYDPYQSQVICPVKKGVMGVDNLNRILQYEINGSNEVLVSHGNKEFRFQDKIMLTRTNYGAGYVNGDIGTVVDVSENGGLIISYYAGLLEITPDNFSDIDLAYAITVHKAQGSEFSKVHIVLPEAAKNMMTRRLLHTAVSRAKEEVITYNEGSAFREAIQDTAGRTRFTKLGSILSSRF